MKKDWRYVYWAYMADPVAHSILTPDEIEQMTKEILKAQEDYLPKELVTF